MGIGEAAAASMLAMRTQHCTSESRLNFAVVGGPGSGLVRVLAVVMSMLLAAVWVGSATASAAPAAPKSNPVSGMLSPSASLTQPEPKRFKTPAPRFTRKLAVRGKHLMVGMKVAPWRTARVHRKARPDRLVMNAQVSRKGIPIGRVGAGRTAEVQSRLIYNRTRSFAVPPAASVRIFKIALPAKVKRSLRGLGAAGLAGRVRVTVDHLKDVRRDHTYGLQQVTQYDPTVVGKKENRGTARSAAGDGDLALRDGPDECDANDKYCNVAMTLYFDNYTPFDQAWAISPVICVAGATISSDDLDRHPIPALGVGPGQLQVSYYHNDTSGKSDESEDGASGLAAMLASALKDTAKSAASSAIGGGAESFTPAGAIDLAVQAGVGFVTGFIKQILNDPTKCQNIKSTYSTSFTPVSLGNEGTVVGDPHLWSNNYWEQGTAGQSREALLSQIGAQYTTQWWANPQASTGSPTYGCWGAWKPVPDEGGGSFQVGGFLQATGPHTCNSNGADGWERSGTATTSLLYLNTASEIYGPTQQIRYCEPPNVTTDCVQLTAATSGNTPGVYNPNEYTVLQCNEGAWDLVSPFGGNYSLGAPPPAPEGFDELEKNQLTISWYYAGVQSDGKTVRKPIPKNTDPTLTKNYESHGVSGLTVNTTDYRAMYRELGYDFAETNGIVPADQPDPIQSFGCSVQGYSQMPDWSGESNDLYNGANPNMGWFAYPAEDLTAPAPRMGNVRKLTPGPVQDITYTPAYSADSQAVIQAAFAAPLITGSSDIKQYWLKCGNQGDPDAVNIAGQSSPLVSGPVAFDTEYSCTVQAENGQGMGEVGGPVEVTTLLQVPSAVRNLVGTSSLGWVRAEFDTPEFSGVSPITDYQMRCTGESSHIAVTEENPAGSTEHHVIDLTPFSHINEWYSCNVNAQNSSGWGTVSNFRVQVP